MTFPAWLSFDIFRGWRGGKPRARATSELERTVRSDGTIPELRVEAGLASDPGCVRSVNEDALRVILPSSAGEVARRGVLAVVCDGMGGHEAGEIASHLAIQTIIRRFEDERDPATSLVRSVQAANRAVHDTAAGNAKLRGMGTTCTAIVLRGGLAYCAHVGDSRLYLVRNGELFLMTEDHSAVMELVRKGVISRDEARHHPDKNVISRALGSHREVEVSSWPQPFTVSPNDVFLLCSDGLHDLVEDADLLVSAQDFAPQTACDRLVNLARERGGYDNISVAVLSMTTAGSRVPEGVKTTRTVEIRR